MSDSLKHNDCSTRKIVHCPSFSQAKSASKFKPTVFKSLNDDPHCEMEVGKCYRPFNREYLAYDQVTDKLFWEKRGYFNIGKVVAINAGMK